MSFFEIYKSKRLPESQQRNQPLTSAIPDDDEACSISAEELKELDRQRQKKIALDGKIILEKKYARDLTADDWHQVCKLAQDAGMFVKIEINALPHTVGSPDPNANFYGEEGWIIKCSGFCVDSHVSNYDNPSGFSDRNINPEESISFKLARQHATYPPMELRGVDLYTYKKRK